MSDNKLPSVSASILIGAVIIAGAIIYVKHAPAGSAGAAAIANAPIAQTNVKVADRVGEPVQGSASAKVTMVEFADFQCPYCKSFFTDTFNQIKTKYIDTGKVKLIYRNYPLPFHVNAEISAEAGECANLQGKFWPYHDLLFSKSQSDGTNLDKASLEKYAANLGLDTAKFNSCLESGAAKTTVAGDLSEGQKDGVTGTPTFYINGKQIVGAQPYAVFESAIEAALKG